MKLKNKKTGEIGYTAVLQSKAIMIMDENAIKLAEYTSIAKLNEEWEDYEEPKEYWYIDCDGEVYSIERLIGYDSNKLKEIGNLFETEEEAEKAVEKLKAWKRLRDKGFSFDGIAGITNEIYFKAKEPFTHIMVDEYTADKAEKEYIDDLMLLFGGEE